MIADDFNWWLLIGGETGLPSIGRRVEGMVEGVRAITLVAVTGPAEEQVFNTRADHQAVWIHRPPDETTCPQPLVDALKRIKPPPGEGFVWIAAEARIARARTRLHHQHQTPSGAMAPGNGILGRRPGGCLRTAGQLVSPRVVSILRNHQGCCAMYCSLRSFCTLFVQRACF